MSKQALSVVPVTPNELWQLMGLEVDMATKAYAGVADGRLIATGGLAWGGGRCWIWLMVHDEAAAYPMQIVRWARRMFRVAAQLGETAVFTPRDDEYPSSKKLLTMLGFEFVEIDPATGKEIWSRWVN